MFYLCFEVTHFLPQFNYIFFFIVMLHCFNTAFFPSFFCNFTTILYIHIQKKKKFSDEGFLFWPNKIINCISYQSHAYFFLKVFDFTLLNLIISYFSFSLLKLSFILSYLSFSFKILINSTN